MGNFLESPNTEKHSHLFHSHANIEVGVAGMQGWRTEMEDDHVWSDMPSRPDHLFLGVFDGHGGSGAAIFAAKNIIKVIEDTDEWKRYVTGKCESIELLGEALCRAFVALDGSLRNHQSTGRDTSGCTSVTAMITPTHIICANAGDSRCVLGTNFMAKALSDDHKPTDELERKRIEQAGGTVQWKRVDGDLAVSRAFGDFQFKNRADLAAHEQKVSCYPDISVHERTVKDEVLLLACDGLWDVMTNNEAIDLLRKIFQSGEQSISIIAEEMVDVSLRKGSRDNISAVVAKLPGAVVGAGGGITTTRSRSLSGHIRDRLTSATTS